MAIMFCDDDDHDGGNNNTNNNKSNKSNHKYDTVKKLHYMPM